MAFHQGSTGRQHLASQDLLVDAHGILYPAGCVVRTVRSWSLPFLREVCLPRNIHTAVLVRIKGSIAVNIIISSIISYYFKYRVALSLDIMQYYTYI